MRQSVSYALLLGLSTLFSSAEAQVVVDSVDINTQQAGIATTYTFTASGTALASDNTNQPFIKVVAPGGAATDEGVAPWVDALTATAGVPCVYVDATSCTIISTAPLATAATSALKFFYAETKEGTYTAFGTPAVNAVTAALSAARVLSTTHTSLQAGVPLTVTFITTNLKTFSTDKAFIKIVASGVACGDATGITDALTGAACELSQTVQGVNTAVSRAGPGHQGECACAMRESHWKESGLLTNLIFFLLLLLLLLLPLPLSLFPITLSHTHPLSLGLMRSHDCKHRRGVYEQRHLLPRGARQRRNVRRTYRRCSNSRHGLRGRGRRQRYTDSLIRSAHHSHTLRGNGPPLLDHRRNDARHCDVRSRRNRHSVR